MRCEELLTKYEFPGDETPIIRGSALKALEGDPNWTKSIDELMDAVDNYVPLPTREIDKPFLMPVEDVFTISGRGTVVTGRVERGRIKVGEDVEIVGFRPTVKTVATGVEMFRKILDEGPGRRQRRDSRARYQARGCRARTGAGEAREHHAAHPV